MRRADEGQGSARLAASNTGVRRLCNTQIATANAATPVAIQAAELQLPSRRRSIDRPASCAGKTCAGAQISAEVTLAIKNRRVGIPAMPATRGTVDRSTGMNRHSATLNEP